MDESSALDPRPPATNRIHWLFVSDDGIRAGWGALLFAVLCVVFFFLFAFLLRPFLHGLEHIHILPAKLALLLELVQFLPTILATAILALIERRSPLSYGLQGTSKTVRFLSGGFWGFAALSAFLLVLWKAHLLVFDGMLLHGAAIVKYALVWAFYFVMVALFEETTLRGYLQYTLIRGIGFWWGALLLSLLFGLSHTTNPGETPVGLWMTVGIGLVFCLSLWYTGSLWWALGFHASWDWAESYFYGTSDSGILFEGHLFSAHPSGRVLWSGGTTGPEGSLLVFLPLAVIALLMWLWWGRRTVSPFRSSAWRPAWSRRSLEGEDGQSDGLRMR